VKSRIKSWIFHADPKTFECPIKLLGAHKEINIIINNIRQIINAEKSFGGGNREWSEIRKAVAIALA
jgi:hypothetical protein